MASVPEIALFSPVGESEVAGLPSDNSSDSACRSASNEVFHREVFSETTSAVLTDSAHQNCQVGLLKSSWSAADAQNKPRHTSGNLSNPTFENRDDQPGYSNGHQGLWRTRRVGVKRQRPPFPPRVRVSQSVKSMEARLEGRKRIRYDTSVRLRLAGLQRDVDRLTLHNLVLRDALQKAKEAVTLQSESPKWSTESSPKALVPPPAQPSPVLTSVSEMRRTLASLEESLAASHRDRQEVALELKRTRAEKEALLQSWQSSNTAFSVDGTACGNCSCDRMQALQLELANSKHDFETFKSDSEVKVKYLTDTGVRWKTERDEATEQKDLLHQQIEALFFIINKKDENIFNLCNNFFKMKLAKESTEEELLQLMVLHNKILDKVLDQLNDVNEDNSYLIRNLNQLAQGGESDFDRRLTDVMRQKVGHELDKYRLLKEKNRLTLEVACLSTDNDRLQWELDETRRAIAPQEEQANRSSEFCDGLSSPTAQLKNRNGRPAKAEPSVSSDSGSDRSDTHLLPDRSSTSGCSSVDCDNNSLSNGWLWGNGASEMNKNNNSLSEEVPSTAAGTRKPSTSSPTRHSVTAGAGTQSSVPVRRRALRDRALKVSPLGVRTEAGPFHLDLRSTSATHQTLQKAFGISCDAPRYLSSMSALSTHAGPRRENGPTTSLVDLVTAGASVKESRETRCRAGDQLKTVEALKVAASSKMNSNTNPSSKSNFWSWWKHLSTAR